MLRGFDLGQSMYNCSWLHVFEFKTVLSEVRSQRGPVATSRVPLDMNNQSIHYKKRHCKRDRGASVYQPNSPSNTFAETNVQLPFAKIFLYNKLPCASCKVLFSVWVTVHAATNQPCVLLVQCTEMCWHDGTDAFTWYSVH